MTRQAMAKCYHHALRHDTSITETVVSRVHLLLQSRRVDCRRENLKWSKEVLLSDHSWWDDDDDDDDGPPMVSASDTSSGCLKFVTCDLFGPWTESADYDSHHPQ